MMDRPLRIWPDLVVLPNTSTPADRSIEKRRIRKHSVLGLVRDQGPLSRAAIARVSGYNLPTVSSLVDELVHDGLVTEEEAKPTRRGRRPIPVTLQPRAAMVMGIDVARGSTIGLLLDLAGVPLTRYEEPTPRFKNASGEASWVREFADRLCASSIEELPPLAGIGVGVPELIPLARGDRYVPHSLHEGTLGESVRLKLDNHFHVPILVDNDARMVCLGTIWFGDGKRFSDFSVLNISERLGLGIVAKGAVYQGYHGYGGQINRLPLGGPEPLEDIVSGVGLTRQAEMAGLGALDALALADLARSGDKKALKIFHNFSTRLGIALAMLMNIGDPQALMIGGRLSRAADLFLEQARAEAARHVASDAIANIEILVSPLREDAGALGAAASILHRIFSASHIQLGEVL